MSIQSQNLINNYKQQVDTLFSHPPLITMKISKRENLDKISSVIKQWIAAAEFKNNFVQSKESLVSLDVKNKITASMCLLKDIYEQLEDEDNTIYITCDEQCNIEAIATVDYSDWFIEIDSLATNPKNILPLFPEQAVRGAAKAVITHIACEVLLDKDISNKKLYLDDLDNATSFYKKLGFTEIVSGKLGTVEDEPYELVLQQDKIIELLQNKPTTHIFAPEQIWNWK